MSPFKPHWIEEKVYGFEVERLFIPRPLKNGREQAIRLITRSTGKLVLHSTEGMPKWTPASWRAFRDANPRLTGDALNQAIMRAVSRGQLHYRFDDWTPEEEERAFAGAVNTLAASHAAPHVTIGANRIMQHRMIGQQGAALRGEQNALALVQIEASGNTEGRKGRWQFTDATLTPLVAFLAYCNQHYGIPLRVPRNFPDDMSDCPLPWAVMTNSRRKSNAWETEQGIFEHLEVDENHHFDCAYLKRSQIVEMARRVVAGATPAEAVKSVKEDSTFPVMKPAGTTRTYKVKPGDGMFKIAREQNVPLNILLALNNLKVTSTINPGDVLVLP